MLMAMVRNLSMAMVSLANTLGSLLLDCSSEIATLSLDLWDSSASSTKLGICSLGLGAQSVKLAAWMLRLGLC